VQAPVMYLCVFKLCVVNRAHHFYKEIFSQITSDPALAWLQMREGFILNNYNGLLFLDDFRIFCGDLGNDVTDEILTRAFSKYQSFLKAKVVRDKRSNKTKGFGFVSFKDPQDFIKAMKEMNGEYMCVSMLTYSVSLSASVN
jgi:RNA recognition motif-containing protein